MAADAWQCQDSTDLLETSTKVDGEHFDKRRRHLAIVSAGEDGTGFQILPRRLPSSASDNASG
jgi:hypothetical protein